MTTGENTWVLIERYYGAFTLTGTETDNETCEMVKPMVSVILSYCSVNTFIQFYASHFNRSRYLSQSKCRSRAV